MPGAPHPDRAAVEARAIVLAWVVLATLLLASSWSRIAGGQLPDPDDALRLVQVRDLLGGQGWFDLAQHRIDPPAGTLMHWSRLVDVPLLLVTMVAGETAALIVVPLSTLAVILWAVGKLAARLIGEDKVLFACLACGFMPALVMQIQPLRIDHHGWQIAMVALAALALADAHARRGGMLAGLAMAIGISISVELLPLSAVFAAVLAWRWLHEARAAGWLVGYLQALAGALAILFLLTRGSDALTAWCDAVSPPHLAFFAVVATGATLAERLKLAGAAAIAMLLASGVLGVVALGWWAPQCLALPFAGLDPLVRDYWYLKISEGQPLWQHPADRFIPALVPLVAALAACLALWLRAAPRQRALWAEYALVLAAATVLGLLVARSLAFAAVLSAVPLGWLLAALLERFRSASGKGGKLGAIAMIVLLLAPTAPFLLAERLAPPSQHVAPARLAEAACNVRMRSSSLSQLPEGVVFAPLDLGPSILLDSGHAVVATSHHRAEAAMADVIGAFIAPPDRARSIIARHRADYLALCTDLAEARNYARRHPEGLAANVMAGQVPDWLEPIAPLTTPQFKVFRVRQGGSAAPLR